MLANFIGSPNLRGREGELLVNHVLAKLPEAEYAVYENLLLPSNRGGTTQIDHVVFSCFGIFVIETKNYSGWIFAGEKDRIWTRLHYRRKHKFQNPLRQNYKHICALRAVTKLPHKIFYNIVVFTGTAKFKTQTPENVVMPGDLTRLIRARQTALLSETQVNNAAVAVLSNMRQFEEGAPARHVRDIKMKRGGSR